MRGPLPTPQLSRLPALRASLRLLQVLGRKKEGILAVALLAVLQPIRRTRGGKYKFELTVVGVRRREVIQGKRGSFINEQT